MAQAQSARGIDLSTMKQHSITYSTGREKKVCKIFILFLDSNREGRFWLKKNPYFSPTSENHEIICNTNYFGLLVILWLRICAIGEGRLLEVGACTRSYGEFLNLYTLTSVFIISILSPVHLLMCWQGEFVQQSRVSLGGDHFLYSHDIDVWFSGDIVGRN